MRHAKSDWSDPSQEDFDRPLAARGKKTAPRMGKWLRKQKCIPDVFVSSPALRARQTSLLVAEKLGFPVKRLSFDDRIYEGSIPALQAVIQTHGRAASTLLLVGHNPGLDNLLCYLCSGPPPRDPDGKLLTAGALAVLGYQGGIDDAGGSAELEVLMRPKALEK